MLSKVLLIALAATPLVTAHGKVSVATGDLGGNTTALGIQGGIIPGAGPNKQTEVDTTVFNRLNAATDGLGKTKAGPNTLAGMSAVVAQSGSTLPQVSANGGSISGTLHIVTTDGAGPYTAIVDPTGTGAFSQGNEATVTTQVPGKRGNIAAPKDRRFVARMLIGMGIRKRAANVNEDFPIAIQVPAGTTCTGTVGGQSNVCLMKIANPSAAGPFGGVIAFQVANGATGGAAASNETTSAADTTSAAETTSTKAKGSNKDKGKREFIGAKFRA